VILLVANPTERSYDFKTVDTNVQKRYREHSYTFLDTTEGSVFLNINHLGKHSKYGHIFISDPTGINYAGSLRYNVRGKNGQCDFKKVNSLEGLYIANSFDEDYMKDAEQEIEEKELEEEEEMDEKKKQEITNPYNDFISSVITFNKGGSWHKIKAPDRDTDGKKYDCEGNCYLNLHGITSDFPPFYSVDSAAGIIIGNGNVGKYLSHDQADIGTFLTRDGGLNWFEIKKGSHVYEIGDHGALIVIADNMNPTNQIYYSWDEGLSFQDLIISEEKIMIENVISEPSSTGQHFVVYGNKTKKGKKMGVIVGVDFTSLHEPQCRNPENPDASDSDYEKWTPNDGRAGHECLQGRKVIYVRRKREAQCYNGLDFERKTIVENCSCTEEDFECDSGYYRPGPGEPCTSQDTENNGKSDLHKPPADCRDFYTISKGYRRIPGNTCINGVNYDPYLVPCPYSLFSYLGNKTFAFLLLICIIVLYLAYTKEYFKGVTEILPVVNNKSIIRIPDYVEIVNCF
jgi:hypothetical protein